VRTCTIREFSTLSVDQQYRQSTYPVLSGEIDSRWWSIVLFRLSTVSLTSARTSQKTLCLRYDNKSRKVCYFSGEGAPTRVDRRTYTVRLSRCSCMRAPLRTDRHYWTERANISFSTWFHALMLTGDVMIVMQWEYWFSWTPGRPVVTNGHA